MPSYKSDYLTTTSSGLTPAQAALARHHSYELFSQIFLTGITNENLHTIQAVPELACHLPDPLDLNETAANHYQLFGFNVFPYETIFLDDSGLLGSQITEGVTRSYHHFGFSEMVPGESADHIGQELAAMAYLCAAEMEALSIGAKKKVAAVRRHQVQFLQDHLLRWLSPFILSVRAQNDAFFVAVAELASSFIHDHYQYLLSNKESVLVEWMMPKAPDLLSDSKTGLKDIAAFLTTAVLSGVFLSRDDISHLAQSLGLPRGFGDRKQLLTNLMRAAVQYEIFPNFLEALQLVLTEWQSAYQQQKKEMPSLAAFIQPWQERLEQSLLFMSRIRHQLGTSL